MGGRSRVFDEANVDTAIVSYTKSNESSTVDLYESNGASGFYLIKNTTADFFLNKIDAIINIEAFKNSSVYALVDKIETSLPTLKQVADVRVGLKAYQTGKGKPLQTDAIKSNRIYHSRVVIDESYFYYLDGKDVSRYMLGWNGEYLKYGVHLAEPRKWTLFSTPRILVRQIPAQPPYCIHACFTEEVKLNDLNSMNIVNIKEQPLFVLALLNSRLLSFWFIHKFGKLQRGIFPQFKINELEQFPIATCSYQQLFVDKVKAIMKAKAKAKDADTTELEREIDDMVYRLYGLTYDEVKTIEPEYNSMSREEYEAAAIAAA
jgi:TaqI-like C-terminal specificity domain